MLFAATSSQLTGTLESSRATVNVISYVLMISGSEDPGKMEADFFCIKLQGAPMKIKSLFGQAGDI